MDFYEDFKNKLNSSQIIQLPSMNIDTFGNTNYLYYHLSKTKDLKTSVREGQLVIKKPMIIAPHMDGNLVDGFDREIQDFAEKLFQKHGRKLKLLGYQFRHIPREAWIEKDHLDKVMIDILNGSKDNPMTAVLVGEEKHWEISLLKIYSKVIKKSFNINVSELEERGMFDEDRIPPQVYREIEELFKMVEKYPSKIKDLGKTLLRYNLFEKYEDRFFKAMKRK